MNNDFTLQIMFDRIDAYHLSDVREELINVLTASVYRNASGYARNQIIEIWGKIEEEMAKVNEPPTEEQLSLEHPELLDVE
jgi:hypothetical protein